MFNLTSSIPIVRQPSDHPIPPHGDFTTGGEPVGSGLPVIEPPIDEESQRPIWQSVLAGGIGGAIGDSVMHSLDTVKTRQQGAPNVLKYRNMWGAYRSIFIEEGLMRGLYGGYFAAMVGSFPSAAIFFGTYEFSKRKMIYEWGVNETTTYLISGLLGDLVSSIVYVPSEVLKTRLQLQGRYNNTYFDSGYNYRNLRDAIKTIVKTEGFSTLFFGYKATLARDLPFSALQFAFYEKFRQLAFNIENKNIKEDALSITSEILTGASAGGLAGIITTPLDVVKTRVQTQQSYKGELRVIDLNATTQSKPSTLTNSMIQSLRTVYRTEGITGYFSGVGPRFIWTSVQSSIMLLLYQVLLRGIDNSFGVSQPELE
ncbi:hypothetical protein Kpol_1043p20 [Vanderwaltozyma polyspora DSM 70294]|uniref:Mitochondrial carrier protein n=1 Tax=Vanderwaltozyma polyspora (strain ATCC 22028 / DSM 70294 / BCRC 21397 / CBS 2163 / NBRC 10782 / NRRL Y-8283 / UCD 57-17) TaxID=436907 RepID=A7TIN8_VANPO|nr:uncharacterized protein Kpol_1043p20 [Vanderwaltozyma polyspora DSM 70294]EDO17830.1 hypothetical protein Kpol_1043p20 [Vanderwaltozyma polyspora DSM 70294]